MEENLSDILVELFSGALGGAVSSFVTYPLTNLRIKIIDKYSCNPGTFQKARTTQRSPLTTK